MQTKVKKSMKGLTINGKLLKLAIIFSLALFSSSDVFAEAPVERLFWDKAPLAITLTVGQERLVTFPADIRVGIP